ncbi:DUF4350 domain-containing protein [Cellulomonas marina]|uniref:DUF4350 domain-containing protein n=1 Tax=Cellulomonas marina TaxID=988821 RepID=A0A1I0V0M3_9CELL|nr:DUF4350 domain-containing protein [Cellulomonas marina]GIG29881.1 hypothetical protein Cma02nite_24810 [Cellulomonas marina]SFA69640.1 protein of unknown function [Cellulomonas marina]
MSTTSTTSAPTEAASAGAASAGAAAPAGPPADAGHVVGDGTTARSRAAARWRRARFPLLVVAGLVLLGVLLSLPEPRTSPVPLAPDNVEENGARAVAEVLGDQGVDVTYARTTARAVAAAGPGTTLLVTSDVLLTDAQVDAVGGTGADLVLVTPGFSLPLLTDALETAYGISGAPTPREAACADPDAVAAGTVSAAGGVRATAASSDAVVCFPDADGAGAYATVTRPDGTRLTVLSDPSLLTNDAVLDEGNAALALRALGRQASLVWYVPSFDDLGVDPTGDDGVGGSPAELLPPAAGPLALQALLVVVVAALWRARRTGRLVTEPLPVVVRAAETVRGRGRLYRRGRSYGRAAAALRAGCAARCGARLGLPRAAPAPAVIDAVARATGRDRGVVEALLYGPPPRGDAALTRLATDLDHLESEVNHP